MNGGFATADGTARYRDRFPALRDAGHFRQFQNVPGAGQLWLSSVGLGTYLGEPDSASDAGYVKAIIAALRLGINVLDTAINYRHQRSERNIGSALQSLIATGEISRDEVLVCTKAGYLSFDGEVPADPRAYFRREYIESGILDPAEVAGGMHCMSPIYLAEQIERSRKNLVLETIDVFYIHNPETQLGEIARREFRSRISRAFTMLEKAVARNIIRFYGMATWNGFRVPSQKQEFLNLGELVEIAKENAGDDHHFRFIQLPFSLAMPEAFALKNQSDNGKAVSTLELADQAGIAVVGSASLSQGRLTSNLPEAVHKLLAMNSEAETAIQFARSAPGLAVALVGMGREEHVKANVQVAEHQLASKEQWQKLFQESNPKAL
ncbi:MAG TPA: aldo/keto reductase [Candidatus Angelobacter sp.]|jgi:aryl-alcohol dehydrogenase-like predicted oxidoreductase|nr:aldo/keto reductase [Candidatus Angelobacter sp.]